MKTLHLKVEVVVFDWSTQPSNHTTVLWGGRTIFIFGSEEEEEEKNHEPWYKGLEQDPKQLVWGHYQIQIVSVAICFIDFGACIEILFIIEVRILVLSSQSYKSSGFYD